MTATTALRPPRSPWHWIRWAWYLLPAQVGIFAIAAGLDLLDLLSSEVSCYLAIGGVALLAVTQIALAFTGVVAAVRRQRRGLGNGVLASIVGLLTAGLAGTFGWVVALLAAYAGGGGWGRPLRIRGRQRHPELRLGSDWARGARPDPAGLDAATRAALEALWLHDAQKEHASVPAFARVSWLLAACGAPAALLVRSHRAAIEEIEHAELCFALAAGYGGRTHTVEPMPELLQGGLDVRENAFAVLLRESLADGCLLEDFNADIAAECAAVCDEPVTRQVLQQIAREERSHAEFSWAVVEWALTHDGAAMAPVLQEAIARLGRYRRPTAVGRQKQALVARADPQLLRRHGRLPDTRWAEVWQQRLLATTARAEALLAPALVAAI